MNKATHPTHSHQSLDYIAILSGLSMAGSDVTDNEIEFARHYHASHNPRGINGISFVSPARNVKHSG